MLASRTHTLLHLTLRPSVLPSSFSAAKQVKRTRPPGAEAERCTHLLPDPRLSGLPEESSEASSRGRGAAAGAGPRGEGGLHWSEDTSTVMRGARPGSPPSPGPTGHTAAWHPGTDVVASSPKRRQTMDPAPFSTCRKMADTTGALPTANLKIIANL